MPAGQIGDLLGVLSVLSEAGEWERVMENGSMVDEPKFRATGDRGLLVTFGPDIDPGVNQKVRAMHMALQADRPDGILEIVPAYGMFPACIPVPCTF